LSSTGNQRGTAGLVWFDNDHEVCQDGTDVNQPGTCGIVKTGVNTWNIRGIYCHPVNHSCSSGASFPTSADSWQSGLRIFGPMAGDHTYQEIPPNAAYARIELNIVSRFDNNSYASEPGTIWFDDVSLEPVLAANANTLIGKDCRLFPKEDSPSCDYQADKVYQGWQGYCLEADPYYQTDPLQPNSWQNCLQWYPVDAVAGENYNAFSSQPLGYQGRRDLYYCLQSQGLAKFDTTDQHRYNGYIQFDNSKISHVSRCEDHSNNDGEYTIKLCDPHDGMKNFNMRIYNAGIGATKWDIDKIKFLWISGFNGGNDWIVDFNRVLNFPIPSINNLNAGDDDHKIEKSYTDGGDIELWEIYATGYKNDINCSEGSPENFLLRIGRDKRVNGSFIQSKPTKVKLKKIDSIKEELEEFCGAIRKGTEVETGFNEGLNALALIEACYQSNKTNKAVLMRNFREYYDATD